MLFLRPHIIAYFKRFQNVLGNLLGGYIHIVRLLGLHVNCFVLYDAANHFVGQYCVLDLDDSFSCGHCVQREQNAYFRLQLFGR